MPIETYRSQIKLLFNSFHNIPLQKKLSFSFELCLDMLVQRRGGWVVTKTTLYYTPKMNNVLNKAEGSRTVSV